MPRSPTPDLRSSVADRHRRLCGLLVRRERWSLSWWGKLLGLAALGALLLVVGRNAHYFLSVTAPVLDGVLVVEGWITTRRVAQAAKAFRQGHYQRVVVVRNIFQEGNKWESGRYSADWVAADLVELGVPKDVIEVLFCPVVHKDRTYSCAVAVRQWLEQNQMPVSSMDVATVAAHTRRSRLLYEKVFGSNVRVGAIALEDPTYDPAHWWRTSEGIREVPFEALAYLYVKLLFHPADAR